MIAISVAAIWEFALTDVAHLYLLEQDFVLSPGQRWLEFVILALMASAAIFASSRHRRSVTGPALTVSVQSEAASPEVLLDRLARCQTVAQVGSWEYDPRTGKVWWSDEIYRLIGYSPGTIDPDLDVVVKLTHLDDREKLLAATKTAVKNKSVYDLDHRLTRADGVEIVVHERGEVICDENGNVVQMMGTVQDITDRKKIEAELQQAHDHMELRVAERTEKVRRQAEIIDQIHDAVISTDLDGLIDSWNKGAERVFGYRKDQVLGLHGSLLFSDYDSQALDHGIVGPLKDLGTLEFDATLSRQDGTHFTGQLSLSMVVGDDGAHVGMIGYVLDVTERRMAEQKLAESERNLRSLTDISPVGIYRSDLNGQLTYVNERWRILLGISPSTALGNGWIEAIHPDDMATTLLKWQKFVSAGDPYENEVRIVRPDGTTAWMYSQATQEHDTNGNLVGYVGTLTDVSEQKAAKNLAEIARSRAEKIQARLNDAIESFSAGFALFDSDDRVVLCNSAYLKDNESIAKFLEPGTPFEDLVRAMYRSEQLIDERYRTEENIQKRLDIHRNPEKGPYTAQTVDGHWILVHEYRTQEGGITLIRTDITERVNAEHALKKSEAELQTMTRLSPVGIFRTDLDGRVIYVNEKWKQITGLDGELGLGDSWALSLHPDDRNQVYAAWAAAVEVDGKYAGEYRIVTPSGNERWVFGQATPELDASGKRIGYVGAVTDINEQKSVQRELVEARELAEAASDAKSQFLSSMSHELRTPMNAILGFAQLLDQDEGNLIPQDRKQFAEEILASGYHLLDLVNDVLDLEKIESGRLPMNISDRPLKPLLDTCLTMVNGDARKRGVTLTSRLSEDENAVVRVDELRFKQTLLNLLSNAVKYNRPDGEVVLECHKSLTGGIRISVSDTGQGIAQDRKDKLFEPFERLGAENSTTPGTGIGLTIARELVESMGGNIGCESIVGQGSTFWVELPSSNEILH